MPLGRSIAVDARSLEPTVTGVGRYLRNLLEPLAGAFGRVTLYHRRDVDPQFHLAHPALEWRRLAAPRGMAGRVLWEQRALPRALRADPPDLFFSPAYTLPWRIRARAAVTIFDLSYEALPEEYRPLERAYYQFFSRRAARSAALVLTATDAVASEIAERYGVAREAVRVVPLAVDPRFLGPIAPDAIAASSRKWGLGPRYILFVGSMFRRRNVGRLVGAFLRARARHQDLVLMLVGRARFAGFDLADELARRAVPAGAVRHEPYVDERDLPPLLAGASVFAYPSTYEGFGLPPLEAIACGAPVVAGDCACLREVLGDAARFVDPVDEESFARQLLETLESEPLRARLREAGRALLPRYAAADMARRTIEALLETAHPA